MPRSDFGEPLLRAVFAETSREVEALDEALEAIAGCQRRLVLPPLRPHRGHRRSVSHRASGPSSATRRLAGPIGAHRPDAVFHGHAHHGTARALIGEVPVWNVARHVTDQDFAVVEI